jgi:hypothetical protein
MPNLSATIKRILSYTGPSSESLLLPTEVLAAPYQAQLAGTIDVPVDVADNDPFDIPFGSIAAPTLVIIENASGQELEVKINGAAAVSHTIPNGGFMIPVASSSSAAIGTPITAIQLIATGTGSAVGRIAYRIFGDAV